MEKSEEKSERSANRRRRGLLTILIICILIIISVVVTIILNLGDKTTVTSSGEETTNSIEALSCSSTSKSAGSFFDIKDALNVNQQFNITFKNDTLSVIMYSLTVDYDSEKTANQKNASLHAAYNLHFSEHNTSHDKISDTFTYDDKSVKVSIYAEKNAINNISAPVFLLDTSGNYTVKQLQTHYADKGYKCDYKK